ncbi:MAG TPA: tetratricopeptide repeat protein [Phycisphaerae bacterium]|nr:tetratricopeptide repeat protein [Phycisphaerae bacterium]HRY70519.1 tetratricopeptide repeat protein [Phycisphaerae bacterium]
MGTASSSRIFKLVMVLLAVAVVGAGLYELHKYRKTAAVKKALAAGEAAYEARDYTNAATELGRYVAANKQDVPMLLKYADAQLKRRPQSRGAVTQAVAALDTILRLQPAHAEAADRLVTLFLGIGAPAEAEHAAEAWHRAAPESLAAQRLLARAYWANDKRAKAAETLDRLTKAHPEDYEAASLSVSFILAGEIPVPESTPASGTAPAGEVPSVSASAPSASADRLLATWDRCVAVLDEAVARNPKVAAARIVRASHTHRLARIFAAAGESQRAQENRERVLQDLAEAVRLESTNWEDVVQIAQLFVDVGRRSEANAQFDRAESLAPTEVDVYLVRCALAIDMNDAEGGAAVLDRAFKLPLGDKRYDLLAPAVELYAMANRPKDARARLDEARKPDTPAEVLRYLEGVVAFAEGNVADAMPKLEEALKLAGGNPRLVSAYLWLGRAYVASGNPRRAISPLKEYVRAAAQVGRSPATGQMALSQVYSELGRWEDAIKASTEARANPYAARSATLRSFQMQSLLSRPGGAKPDARKIEALYKELTERSDAVPKDVAVKIQLAQLTYFRGQLEEAVKILKSTRDELPETATTTTALVGILIDAGKHREAIEECTAAISSADKTQLPLFQAMLAEVYARQGDQEMARKTFTAAAEQATGSGRTLVRTQLAEWLARQQHVEEAREVLSRIVEEEPGNVAILNRLLALRPDPGKSSALVEQLRKAEGESGLNWRYWQAVGWLESDDWQDHRREIEANLNECLAKDPEFSEAALALTQRYRKAGEWELALGVSRKAFALDSQNVQLAVGVLEAAARLQRWSEVDQVLAALPAEALNRPEVRQFRIQQAFQRGDARGALALLEEQVKDGSDYVARLNLARVLSTSPEGAARARQLLAEAAAIKPEAPEVLAARVEFHVDRSEFKEALDLCGEAIARKPSADAYQLRARVYEAQRDLASAAADLHQVASLEGRAEEGYLAVGRMYYRQNRFQQAVESWEAGLKLVPGSYMLRGALAEARVSSGNKSEKEKGQTLLDELLRDLEEGLRERPKDEQLLNMRDELLLTRVESQLTSLDEAQFKLRKPEEITALLQESEGVCDRILARNPKSSFAYALLAQAAFVQEEQALRRGERTVAQRQRARGLDYLDRGVIANPQDPRLLVRQAQLLLEANPDRAVVAARSALELQPGSEASAILYASSLARAGRGNEAIAALSRFLERSDAREAFNARLALAEMSSAAKDFVRAEAVIKQAEAMVAGDKGRQAAVDLGRLGLLASQRQWESFVTMARECLAKNAGDVILMSRVGATLLESGDPIWAKTGVEFLEMVTRQRPDDPLAFSQLGIGHYRIGQLQEAAAAFEQGLKLDPDHLQLSNDLAWLMCEEQKKPEEAARRIAKAIETIEKGSGDPVVGSLWDTWGVIQYRLGKLDGSKQALEKCLGLGEELAESTRQSARFHLARTLATIDRERSAQLLRELLAIPKKDLRLSDADLTEAQALRDQLK